MTSERKLPAEMPNDEIRERLDILSHTGYTCDRYGGMSSRADDRWEAWLEQHLDGEYEHDPETCKECQEMDKIVEQWTDE